MNLVDVGKRGSPCKCLAERSGVRENIRENGMAGDDISKKISFLPGVTFAFSAQRNFHLEVFGFPYSKKRSSG